MQVHTVVLTESNNDEPEVAGIWQFTGKSGEKKAKKYFRQITAGLLGLNGKGKWDDLDFEDIETAWYEGKCCERNEDGIYQTVEYFQHNCRGK